ncbi:MAG: molybdopterin-dependent oxidoreductase [Euryarchaeota archaeon]|nr:molybdopterin-dependent oxidoreductase [Euryarchaeota archaeon]
MKLTRRDAIKLGVAAGAAAYATYRLGGFESLLRPAASGGYSSGALTESRVASVCLQCPAGCGIVVRVVDGRAVKIEGNPTHPINLGRLCPKGQIGLQILYDPDRIKQPYVREELWQAFQEGSLSAYLAAETRDRTPEDLIPVPGATADEQWDNALEVAAAALRLIRESSAPGEGPHQLLFMSGRNRGQMGGFIDRFCAAYGTPNHIGHSSICADGSPMAHWATQGWKAYSGYDWDNTNYLLCFGGAFLEAWRPTTRLLRAHGTMRQGRPVRAKIVQVDVRFSVTAAKADEWIPIKPGTDGALALGIAHVIIQANLYDAAYVQEHTFGFEDWTDPNGAQHVGWKNVVLQDYAPELVSGITGVPVETIERVAREFATTRPAIAAGERGASMQTNGVYNRIAIHALNALVGSFGRVGGPIRQREPPLASVPAATQDENAIAGGAQPAFDFRGTIYYPLAGKVYQGVPDFILGKPDPGGRILVPPYRAKALLCYYTNPLYSTPDNARWEEAIRRIPFVMTFSPFMDETTAHADLILPDSTYLERWHDDVIYPSLGFPVVGLRQPVVDPLYATRNTGDVLIQLAQHLGGTVAQSFPWADFLEFLKARYQGIFASGRGRVGDIPLSGIASFEGFWETFAREGVWSDPPYAFEDWAFTFATPSGRFEFYSQLLHEKLEHLAEEEAKKIQDPPPSSLVDQKLDQILEGLGLTARGDRVFLPHFEPPQYVGEETVFPLHLVTYKLMVHAEGRGANVPLLREVMPSHLRGMTNWDTWAEIHPETARAYGIQDGDLMWIESPVKDDRGSLRRIRVRARLYEGARPDTVAMPFELGHTAYGRWAKGMGQNPNRILANQYDLLGGLAAFSPTRIRVSPAGGG